MAIHEQAAKGFAAGADAYERGRPEHSGESVALLARELGFGPGSRVVDLGAGTGKLTRQLVEIGADVIAVEPIAEMRAKLEAALPQVEALAGTAEDLPLPNHSVDGVLVAQAFHWFDAPRALAEIHRVLRPDGLLALLWNRRVEGDPVNRAFDELVDPYRHATPTHRWNSWRAAFERTSLFGPLEEHEFDSDQRLDADGMEARVGSISFIAALDDPERERVLERARALAGDGTVTLAYRSEVQICRRLS